MFFCLLYPRLGAEEAGNLEMPTGANKEAPTKAFSLARVPETQQLSEIENV